MAIGGVLAGVLTGSGGPRRPHGAPTAPTTTAAPTVPATTAPPTPSGPLAVGIDEPNPHLVAPGAQPSPFGRFRDALHALRPRYLRILIDWRALQPSRSAPPNWTLGADGCMRGTPPCAPYSGIRAQLQAARAAGLQPVVVIYDTPAWAGAPRRPGCQTDQQGPNARMPADLGAYRALIRSLLAEGRRDGVALPWWSAWNEPNHPAFLGPQRARCAASARSLAAREYAPLVRALRAELEAAPGEQRMLIGEAAGYRKPNDRGTGAAELAADLPDDVVCSAAAWSQHAYVQASGPYAADPASPDLLAGIERALDRHHCPGGPLPVWIGETGIAPTAPHGCEQMATALRDWARDDRVAAAFQYTFREDPAFPVGLADAGLTTLRPAYRAWLAYARGGVRALAHPAGACA